MRFICACIGSFILLNTNIWELLITIPAVLLALTFHEAAHGFVAYRLGDTTARDCGRLTLNPFRHLDLLGLVCMVVLRFGWAKPVPVDPRRFRHPRRDMALVAAAGPLMNVILSFFCILFYYLFALYFPDSAFANAMGEFFVVLAVLSVGFAVFNLIPLPPLDGSRILSVFLPPKWNYMLVRYERYIQIALILLLWTGVLSAPLSVARGYVLNGIEDLVRWMVL